MATKEPPNDVIQTVSWPVAIDVQLIGEPVDPYAYMAVREWGTAEHGYPLTSISHSQTFGWQCSIDGPHGSYFYGYGKSPRAAYQKADQQRRLKKYGDLAQVVEKFKMAEYREDCWIKIATTRQTMVDIQTRAKCVALDAVDNLETEIRGLEHTNAVRLGIIDQQAATIKNLQVTLAAETAVPYNQAIKHSAADNLG